MDEREQELIGLCHTRSMANAGDAVVAPDQTKATFWAQHVSTLRKSSVPAQKPL
jgi:hypothetical protein